MQRNFNKGVLNPLDGVQVIKGDHLKTVGVMSQYYINVFNILISSKKNLKGCTYYLSRS